MNGNDLGKYEDVRSLIDSVVNSALLKVAEGERKMKVLEVLAEVKIAYKSIKGLRAIKALNMDKEAMRDQTQEEIKHNYNAFKSKLSNPKTDSDVSLYDALKKNLVNYIDPGSLSWQDPEEPCENMKCNLPESVVSKCEQFVDNFNKPTDVTNMSRNIGHDKNWKEDISTLEKRAERILSVLGEIWNNPTFENSTTYKEQSEGTYVTDVVMPLLRASLEDMPNGSICLSTAERQSLASKFRRSSGEVNKERMGKKPDAMVLVKCEGKINELAYAECSRIICNDTKKANDEVKLWRETLDGISLVNLVCRPLSNQFGIVGIQVAGEDIYLNVLVNDAGGLSRYFHIDHAEIPLSAKSSRRVKPLLRLLLNLRNILIVNKNLLTQALGQASSRPPRNANFSPTISTPPYIK